MNVLVRAQSIQGVLYVSIAQVSKLVLRLFIRQSETVKTETQKILQEMLLDIVVLQLEKANKLP